MGRRGGGSTCCVVDDNLPGSRIRARHVSALEEAERDAAGGGRGSDEVAAQARVWVVGGTRVVPHNGKDCALGAVREAGKK